MTESRETPFSRKLLAIVVVAIPAGIVIWASLTLDIGEGIPGGAFGDVATALSFTVIIVVLIALTVLLLAGDNYNAQYTRATYGVFGFVTGAAGGWLMASAGATLAVGDGSHAVSPLWAFGGAALGGAAFAFLASAAAGHGRAFEQPDLVVSGSYFSKPFAVISGEAVTWTHRTYNRVDIFVCLAMTGCTIAVATFSIVTLNPGPLIVGALLALGAAIFWATGVTNYRIDARGFSTSWGFGLRPKRFLAADIKRIGVAPTGTALLDDYSNLSKEERVDRDAVVAAAAAGMGGFLYGDAIVGVLFVVESKNLNPLGKPDTFAAVVRKTNVGRLVRAAAQLEPR